MLNHRTRVLPLGSAARIATTASNVFREESAIGAILHFNIAAASGTGGVKVQLRGYNGDGAAVVFYETASFITTGNRTYLLAPWTFSAAANGITAVSAIVLPQVWDVNVIHADGSSYTYSVLLELF